MQIVKKSSGEQAVSSSSTMPIKTPEFMKKRAGDFKIRSYISYVISNAYFLFTSHSITFSFYSLSYDIISAIQMPSSREERLLLAKKRQEEFRRKRVRSSQFTL